MACLSFMYISIFLCSDGKGLMHELHGLHTDDSALWSFLKLFMPFSVHTVIYTFIVSSGRSQWKNSYRKLYWGTRSQPIFSGRISDISYTVSEGLFEAKVNQVNPCFNMLWKSKGFLLTRHWILNLSWNFNITDFGKMILLPFKVTLTPLQSISIPNSILF